MESHQTTLEHGATSLQSTCFYSMSRSVLNPSKGTSRRESHWFASSSLQKANLGPWSQARVQEVWTTLQPPSASMLFAPPRAGHRYSAWRTRVHSRILGFLPVSHVLLDLCRDLMHRHSRQIYLAYMIMWHIAPPIVQKNACAGTLRPREKRVEVFSARTKKAQRH